MVRDALFNLNIRILLCHVCLNFFLNFEKIQTFSNLIPNSELASQVVCYKIIHNEKEYGTDHRGVEAGDLWVVDLTAAVLLILTCWDEGDDPLWIGGCFHIWQAFCPSTWRHEPHEGKHRRHDKVLAFKEKKIHHHLYQHSTTDCNTSEPLKCEEQTNSQSGRPCCFHGTSPVRNSTQRGLPWSRGRKTQRWWRRTRLRRSSPQLGISVRGSLPYRWEHQSKPDGAWEQQHKETLERQAS